MRLLRILLIKLSIVAILTIIIHYYEITVNPWTIRDVQIPNDTNKKEILSTAVNLTYNVWCIFTKISTNSPMIKKFQIFIESLIKESSVKIDFHLIIDEGSQTIAENLIENVLSKRNITLKVQYYNVHQLAMELEDIVSVMSPHFSSNPGTYYSDALFFLSLGLHRIAPRDQRFAVMVDADVKFKVDVKFLFDEFHKFGDKALFGLAPELTPVYRHVLHVYRNKYPQTVLGEPATKGGLPGYNSGVILFHLDRLRQSLEYQRLIGNQSVEEMTKKYRFKGHLGDQDFYTLLGMEHPYLIRTIDCGWNRQLCTWWRDRGYADVFDHYFKCDSSIKLYHGNCNTEIP